MASITWKTAVSGDWSAPALWSGNAIPGALDDVLFSIAGAYIATIADGETRIIRNLHQAAGTIELIGDLTLGGSATIDAGATIVGGSANAGNPQGVISGTAPATTLLNAGLIVADVDGATLQLNTPILTNSGILAARNGGLLFVTSANFTNLSAGTLTGGTIEVSGNGTAIDVVGGFLGNVGGVNQFANGRIVIDEGTITLNAPGATYFGWNQAKGPSGGYDTLETSLTTIGTAGVLNILGGRDYTTPNAFTNSGVLALAGGTFTAASLTNVGGAAIVGFGAIATAIGNGGLIEAQFGTLTLAGGITDTGALQVDAGATLAFSGLYTQALANDGTVAVQVGTLVLNGAVTGTGGYFIEGGSLGTGTMLNLATPANGDVAFNGAFGTLVLDDAAHFGGSIIGYGTGDTIDLGGISADAATFSTNTLHISNGGIPVYDLPLVGDYAGASFIASDDGAGGTFITVVGASPRDFVLEGPAWASKTITWSIAGFQYTQDAAHPFSSSIDPVGQAPFVAVIQQALDRWAAIAGFNFVELADSGAFATAADLRFGWGDLLGTGGEIGQAAFSFIGNTFVPDTVIRLQDPALKPLVADAGVIGGFTYQGLSSTLYQIAIHEIGHALGLGHSTDPRAAMFPTATGVTNQDANASDIAGIHALYDNIPCFAAGTALLTATGPVAVEGLAVGQRVVTTLSGRLRRIGWIGHRRVAPARHRVQADVTPIRIRADAFGPGQPLRDLRLSPDHAVFLDGCLIPIRHLVNDVTILPDPVTTVTYYHVELADHDGHAVHDVMLAEGMAVESFLDTGNRDAFADAPAPAVHPDFARRMWDSAACAPLHEGGPLVAAVRARLLAFALVVGGEKEVSKRVFF